MYDVVMHFCEGLDRQSIVPAQLPLLLEFLCSYQNNDQLEKLKIEDTKSSSIPSFVPDVIDIGEDLKASNLYLLFLI